MKTKVVQSDKHRVGVTLFGTRNTSDADVGYRVECTVCFGVKR